MDQHIDRRRFVALGLAGAAATALGTTAIGSSGTAQAAEAATTPTEPVLLAADEFDGPAGTAPNPGIWRYDLGAGGWGNAELQTYTDSRRNAALDGAGNLVITARREADGSYSSARLKSEGTYTAQYGRIEARIRIPRGQGIWPAFWMLGADIGQVGWPACGEIDVMENVGYEPGIVHGTVHGPGYSGAQGVSASFPSPSGAPFADDFHVYGVDWRPGSITWTVDGVAYRTVTRADVGANPWVFDKPFFVILNVAVGGTWPGSPDASTPFPQQMTVDWLRVYQNA
ncbi:glycoside hydrolase family 16 protein [Curtobacterium aurantiacum]|uniref:Glycoside hydrolase family 16 protein n=1 Tax=Curtobacterium aurantiacum TaxID=3236919 RepID=A0ABS5VEV3_9MICO|nr:glycoside hydrolase family 16 protein [Curtobacterium flaccumfaciens]MBT1544820.1 glycoside hydrolase family 16 protein [Curtobacterium flaccumfaciens pv. flaccumfaciens]MBT1588003.1 glycoside hydrolase family 16 protein [Curtobacterium flaccumfaciens pv. flaccumfaciens]